MLVILRRGLRIPCCNLIQDNIVNVGLDGGGQGLTFSKVDLCLESSFHRIFLTIISIAIFKNWNMSH